MSNVSQDALVDFAINWLITLLPNMGRHGKKTMEQAQQVRIQKPSFALKGDLVNRESAMRAIQQHWMLGTPQGYLSLWLWRAGKTRLLEEVSRKTAKSTASFVGWNIWSLPYWFTQHSSLQSIIIEDLDQTANILRLSRCKGAFWLQETWWNIYNVFRCGCSIGNCILNICSLMNLIGLRQISGCTCFRYIGEYWRRTGFNSTGF